MLESLTLRHTFLIAMLDTKPRVHVWINQFITSQSVSYEPMNEIEESKSRRWRTLANASMLYPVRRKGSEGRSIRRIVGNSSEHFRDITAPKWVVTRKLLETTVNADVLDRHLIVRATGTGIPIIYGRLEEWAILYTIFGVRAIFDCLLKN